MERISTTTTTSVLVATRSIPWAYGLALLLLAATAAAEPQPRTDELGRRHFEAGAAYLEQAEYEAALREFQRAHELSERPEILINVATVHERLGQTEQAIAALEQYLEKAPEGEHAETVRVRIENLEERLEREEAEGTVSQEPEPSPSEPTSVPAEPQSRSRADSKPAEPAPQGGFRLFERPFWESERLPAYILFSVSGVSAAGALLTGVLASSEHSDAEERCAPNCTDEEISTGKSLAVTSTVLTGTAVVSAAVGAVLFFKLGEKETETVRQPTVRIGLGPTGANATTTWRF